MQTGKPLIMSYRGQSKYSFKQWKFLGANPDGNRYITCEVFDVNLGDWFVQIIGLDKTNHIVKNLLLKDEQINNLKFQRQNVASVELNLDQIRMLKNMLIANQKANDEYIKRINNTMARNWEFQRQNKENWKKAARVVYVGKHIKKIMGYDPDIGEYDPKINYALYL